MRAHLHPDWFTAAPHALVDDGGVRVVLSRYRSGVAALTVTTPRAEVVVLPYLGQMIWSARFDGVDATMDSMFAEPRPATQIVDTYGCFAYHSGLLAAGVPSAEDDHPLHGEMPCAPMDSAWVEVTESEVVVGGSYEYAQGFGHHYLAEPRVRVSVSAPELAIDMNVTNLSGGAEMPLQYMCHLNPAYPVGARITSNLPEGAMRVRETIPGFVRPTEQWRGYLDDLIAGRAQLDTLDAPEMHDPEIVRFADDLTGVTGDVVVEMAAPEGPTYFVTFDPAQLPVLTQWFLHNADQRVAAYALPGTSRPEGRAAAAKAGTLIHLGPGESRSFSVRTGVRA